MTRVNQIKHLCARHTSSKAGCTMNSLQGPRV